MIKFLFNGGALMVLLYSIAMQILILILALVSAWSLHKQQRIERFGRVQDILTSDSSPPVSIVVPAYNEEAGIVASVRSMAMVSYPSFEIVVVNDGSADGTLEALIEAFRMEPLTVPIRREIRTAAVRGVYRSTLPFPLIVVDKENGGRADALNAGINVARYPYVLLTDADVLLDSQCLMRAMRLFLEDREGTIGVGGNVRPVNGCSIRHGHVVEAGVPKKFIERMQVLEYVRSFIASRPAWSLFGALPLVSGAFGIYRRDALAAVGGLTEGHLGEDLDLTMRLHRHFSKLGKPYRIVYAPEAVIWTEVPTSRRVLRRQRIRWHRGLTQAVGDFKQMLGRPSYGKVGLLAWPSMVLFEFVAPLVEALGWVIVPLALLLGVLNLSVAVPLFLLAFFAGVTNSVIALYLDERFGHFDRPIEAWRLFAMAVVENLGLRQITVWWRIRSLLGGASTRAWGNMERQGVANMAQS